MLYTKERIEELQHRWTTPKGKQVLKLIKESRCYLSPALFREKIHHFPGISDEEVQDGIDLRGINLSGFDFRITIKEDDDAFSEEITILSNIYFEGANLRHCNFQDGKIHNCHFENADLSHAEFNGATISSCRFQEGECYAVNLRGTTLIDCDFNDASIKDTSLNSTIVDQKTTFGEILKSEKEKNYHFASIEYKQIKELYKNSSLHDIADHYHYKELVSKRKITKKTHPLYWLNFLFGDLLCKYGTSFVRVIFASLIMIAGCAFLYTSNNSLLFHNSPINPSFWDSLYFSLVSFTTLGYGDYHAVGAMRFVAATESFLGAALMALFTVIVARKIIRD